MKLILIIILVFTTSITAGAASQCPEGYTVNSNGRCTLTDQAVQTNVTAQSCYNLTGEERLTCMREEAERSAGQQTLEDDEENLLYSTHTGQASSYDDKGFSNIISSSVARYGMPALATSYVAYYFMRNKVSLNKCASVSMGFLLAGAVSSFVTEYLAFKKYKDGVDQAQSAYESEANSISDDDQVNAYSEIQLKAFDYMIAQEQAKIDSLIKRRDGYTVASIAYYAASAAAIVESVKNSGQCQRPMKTSSFNQMDEYSQSLLYSLIPETFIYKDLTLKETVEILTNKLIEQAGISSAMASGPGGMAPAEVTNTSQSTTSSSASGLMVQQASNSTKEMTERSIINPLARVVLSGTLGSYALIMVTKTNKHITVSENRKEAIIAAKNEFNVASNSNMSLCTEEMRDDKTKPQCYCYLEGGEKNPIRVNRIECKKLPNNYTAMNPTDYNNVGGQNLKEPSVCLTAKGKFEEGCKSCKTSKKHCNLIPNNFSRIGLGGSKWASQAAQMLDKYNNGSLSSEEFNPASAGGLAARLKALNSKMLNKNPKIKKTTESASKKLIASNAKAFEKMMQSPPGLFTTPSTAVASIGNKKTKNKKDSVLANLRSKFNSSANGKKIRKNEADLDFGFDSAQGSIQIDDNFAMNDEYKITGDINTNSNQNIFRILSNRYQASGFRRLFDNKNLTQAPSANGSDINEQ